MRAWIVLLFLPLAAAQGHDHAMGSGFAVATDLGASGIAHVGSPVHFEFIAFGDDMVPDFHQDLPFRISLDNKTLYEATTLSGHDYDGVHGFDIVFPRPGTWRAAVLSDGEEVAYRTGEVRAVPLRAVHAIVTDEGGGTFSIDVQTEDGRADHANVLVEIIQDGRVRLRTVLHLHDEPARFEIGAMGPASATLRATAYNAFPGQSNGIAPVTAMSGTFTPDAVVVALAQPTAPPIPAAAKNAAVVVDATDYTVVGTYDPFTIVGPDTLQHLNVLVIDKQTGMPVQHVDFEATLRGPRGVVFTSSSLHEYDGVFTLETVQAVPGQYILDVEASRGAWSGSIQLAYIVAPPVQANVVGPQLVRMAAGAFEAAALGDITWSVANPAGLAFAHGEIDLQIRDPSGLVVVRDKLHTHGDGTFPIRAAFLDPGTYSMDVQPFPLDPQPVGPYYKDSVGTPLGFQLSVTGDAAPWPMDAAQMEGVEPTTEATPLPVAWLLLALGAALLARKR